MGKGKVIILSAPSGSGKSTIINEIINDRDLNLMFSISATNRSPRRGEINGVNYYFLSTEEFYNAINNDELVEFEEVYENRFYGTLKKEIERIRLNGKNAVLDIDVKGAINVKKQFGKDAITIFIQPPSIEILRHRLLSRGTETLDAIEQRISKAEFELSYAYRFDKVVINDILLDAIQEVKDIIRNFIK